MSETPSPQSPFLGGGPKFNQAGNNTPLPGEAKAKTPPPPPLGGPKVWIGVLVVVALLAIMFCVYGNFGMMRGTTDAPQSVPTKPDINPDSAQ